MLRRGASVSARLPGFDFRSFEILLRGVSGRVGRIRLVGRDGDAAITLGELAGWMGCSELDAALNFSGRVERRYA